MGQRRHKRIILGLGILVLVAYLIGGALRGWVRHQRAADLVGALSREGVATVVSVIPGDHQTGERPAPWALVRYKGMLYRAQSAADAPALQAGRQARIIYRTGRSGTVYVDRVEPLRITDIGR